MKAVKIEVPQEYIDRRRTQNPSNATKWRWRKKGIHVPFLKRGPASKCGYLTTERVCAGCGKFHVGLNRPGQTSHFCSMDCYRTNRGGNLNSNWRGGRVDKLCKVCSAPISVEKNVDKNGKGIVCSKQCKILLLQSRKTVTLAEEKVSRSIRTSLRTYLGRNAKGSRRWRDILNYTPKDLRFHLESKFLPGMNWENYGRLWHIDHIKPVSWFRFTGIDDPILKDCWALSNLRPLWAKDNYKKGNRWADLF